jgi:dTDP-glucose pyrophosphorylase/CBS domain-containing protein
MSTVESNRIANWRSVVVTADQTLEDAIVALDKGALGIVLVVEDKRLIGTLTDGDIRRALIRHLPMTTVICDVMFTTPLTAHWNDSRQLMLEKMSHRNLLHLPIVDDDGQLVGLETLKHLATTPQFDNPVFLMAGGFGKRLRPLTDDTPKPLLKVGNVPILEKILLQFIEYGFSNFYISTHYKAEMVRAHFGDGSAWGVRIDYVHEDEPLGTAGSLGLLPDGIDKAVIMMNGDLLTRVNFASLLQFHQENEGLATVCVREYEFQVPYGVIYRDGVQIQKIEEKPVHKFFVNAGIYVLKPALLKKVAPERYLDMPNLLEQQIEAGESITMFPVHEYWLDIGQKSEYQRAQEDEGLL